MSTRPHRKPRHTGALRRVGLAFLSVGIALVLFCGYVFWGSNVAGDHAAAQILERASTQLDHSDAGEASPVVVPPVRAASAQPSTRQATGAQASSTTPRSPDPQSDLAPGDLVGVVSIPSIDLELPVLEGIDAEVLDQGVLGHYPGTGRPGAVGNFALAGHRTTHGAPLYDIDQIEVGDPIVVQTPRGWDVYTMQRQRIVDPEAVDVLAPVPDDPQAVPTESWMVLTSCHPKLSAAQRMVVYATIDRQVSRDQGPPPELGTTSD
ncbi:MAG: class E sortase [Ornithinimicrobium sp.]